MSLCSSGAVLFTHAHPGCRWFHPGFLGSYARGRCVHSESLSSLADTPELVGFICVVWFACARPGGRRMLHPGSFGSLVRPLIVVDYIQKRWFHSCAFWVSVGSSAVVFFTRARLWVVGYIRGRWARSSALSFFPTCVRPGCRWVHWRALVAFISGSWVHSCVF